MPKSQTNNLKWWGPPAVALGAGMWGLETLFRVRLQQSFSSDLLVFYEHILGSLLLLPLLIYFRKGVKNFSKRSLGWLFISGVVGSAFGTYLFTGSLRRMNISVASVLLNLQPLISVTLARFLLKEKIAKGFAKWAMLAIASGMLLSFESFSSLQVSHAMGPVFILGAIFCWGLGTVAGRGVMVEVPLGVAAPMRFIFGIFGTFLVVLFNGKQISAIQSVPQVFEPAIFADYLKLLLIAGIPPLFLYFYGLKYTKAHIGAFCEMSQAIVAVSVAWIVLGAPLKPHQVIAAISLVFAVTQINLLQAKAKAK